jgi:hypothetical protein
VRKENSTPWSRLINGVLFIKFTLHFFTILKTTPFFVDSQQKESRVTGENQSDFPLSKPAFFYVQSVKADPLLEKMVASKVCQLLAGEIWAAHQRLWAKWTETGTALASSILPAGVDGHDPKRGAGEGWIENR